ncbi:MAG: PD-(D/E)XK nuclease family protein [Chloroflexota bacterium]
MLDPDADTRPDDILIVLRDYARYQNAIRETARVYGLPVALHPGHALGDTPPIRELISLITLHDTNINLTDFLRRPLMDALGSAYFNIAGIGRRETELLDRISREFAVVGGRGAWLEAIDLAAQEQVAGEDDDMRKRPALIDEPMREHLRTSLSAFFDAVTPPARATVKMYVAWLEDVIGHDPLMNPDEIEDDSPGTLDMIRQVRRKAPAHVISRDLAALEEFKKVLKSLLSAQLLLRTLEQTRDEITWAEFLADLRSTVERTTIENAPEREGRILITTVTDARGLPHKHVFVPGLSEGIFPLRQPEDPLYLDSERRQLSDSGAGILAASERAADDGLFYEMISLARDTLTLSRPTVKDGAPWVESHLWRAVADVFDDAADRIAASEIRIGEITGITEASTPQEVALAVAHGFTDNAPSTELTGAYNWLLERAPALWHSTLRGTIVESERISASLHSRYTGLITDEVLLAELQRILGPEHRWSASQLNDYGICPFRFFAGRILHLKALEDPQTGMDARQLGSVNHSILEKTYAQLAQQGITIEKSNVDHALSVLEATAAAVLADAPATFGFRASPMWEEEKTVLLDRLRALVRHDFTKLNAQLGRKKFEMQTRQPYRMETPFGIGGHGMLINLEDDMLPIYVRGFIDRIDRMGDDVVVLDYKTGKSQIKLDELQEGRNFQILLYLLATQKILDSRRDNEPDVPQSALGGYFLHIREPKSSGELFTEKPEHRIIAQHARNTIARHIKRARAGDFTVSPSKVTDKKRCTSFCEFYRLCRVAITDVEKPEPRL